MFGDGRADAATTTVILRGAKLCGSVRRSRIGHHAIAPDLGARPRSRFGEQIAVMRAIAVLEEGLLPPVAALGQVIWMTRNS